MLKAREHPPEPACPHAAANYHASMATSQYEYDVLVIGAGHAGTEAAPAAARLGRETPPC